MQKMMHEMKIIYSIELQRFKNRSVESLAELQQFKNEMSRDWKEIAKYKKKWIPGIIAVRIDRR